MATDDDYYDDDLPSYHPYLNAYQSKPSAFLSIIGSYVVIREVVRDNRQHGRQGQIRPRMLVGMSIADISFSMAYFLSTWPEPKEISFLHGNAGNAATCNFVGFLFQFGYSSGPLCNASLAFLNLLTIKYNWREDRLQVVAKCMHGFIWTFALVTAIFPIPLGLYNAVWDTCWFESYPLGCKDSWHYGEEANCTRGNDSWIYAIVFTVFPPWFCLLVCTIIFAMIYSFVRKMEDRSLRYATSLVGNANSFTCVRSSGTSEIHNTINASSSSGTQGITSMVDRKKSSAIARHALRYIAAFLLTFSVDLIASILYYAFEYMSVWLDFVAYVLFPLQGFFNFLIFSSGRTKMKTPEGRLLKWIFFKCCCCRCRKQTQKDVSSTKAATDVELRGQSKAEQQKEKVCEADTRSTVLTFRLHTDDVSEPTAEISKFEKEKGAEAGRCSQQNEEEATAAKIEPKPELELKVETTELAGSTAAENSVNKAARPS